ncbi:MAG: helix-turn-helix transcriptional regulator, partial [Atopobiaceae bacterium]
MKRQPGMARARVIGLFLLLSTPYFLLPSHVGVAGLTNAPACVALGLLVGSAIMLAHVLRPALAYPERMRVIFCVVGVAIAAAFAVPEWVGAIALLLTSYETAGQLVALAVPLYSDVHMSLGYWPLAVSALLLTLATPEFLDDLGYERQISSQKSLTSPNDEHAREPGASLATAAVLLAATLTGAIRTPALVTMVHAGHPLACCLVAMQACLAALVIHTIKHASCRRTYGALACYALGSVVWDCASRIWPLLTPFNKAPLAAFVGLTCVCIICLALALIPTAQKSGKKNSGKKITTVAANDVPHENRRENLQPESLERRPITSSEVNAGEENNSSAKDGLNFLGNARDLSSLTPGELDCVRLLLEGRTQQEIAQHLGKAPSTVRVLLSRSYKKLNVHSAVELRALAHARQEVTGGTSASIEAQPSNQRASEKPNVPDNSSVNSKSLTCSRFRSVWGQLQLPLRVTLLVLLCMPYGTATLGWGAGHALILALGLGFLCSGILRLVSTRTQPCQFR